MYPNTLLYINGQWCVVGPGCPIQVVNSANYQ